MALDNTLTLAEIMQLFHARLRNIEHFLSATVPGFNSDIESLVNDEIDTTALSAAQKTKLKNLIATYKATLPKR